MSTENEGTASTPPVPPSASTPDPAGPAGPPPAAAPTPAEPAPGSPPPAAAPTPAGPGAGAQDRTGAGAPTPPHGHPQPPAYGGGSGAPWPPAPPAPPTTAGWGAPFPATPGAPQAGRPRSGRGGLVAAVLVAALAAGGVGGGIGYWAAERSDGTATTSTTVAAGEAPADFKRDPGTVAAVANKALPSVVTIEAKSGGSDEEGGTGTGFVYDKEGHILTNNHVVASAAGGGTLSATFSNGRKYDAEVIGRAQGYDVAVLKLKNAPSGLTPLPLGNSDRVAVGDSTIAIGAPFGLSNTVTTGIISAKNRPVASGDGGGKNSYMSALQTDASINPGNSGGPLLDARGAVIGINSAIQSPGSGGLGSAQAGSVGLGFAIPVNQAKNVAEQLIRTGQPVYPVIGATVNMTEEGEGATIAEQGAGGTPAITPGGPAAKAGLKPGDVIIKFGNRAIDSGPTLISEIWTHQPGDSVPLTYKRGGKESTVQVTLGERKGDS
ncbi:S1C family serine protease [Streptomyces sp. NRRL S-118]|uniref:S1C family serine protease n=1 Tax=Streptomyces sp. NRRL S-118 TaxID=1463881 RepID=UPI0004CAF836|nr:trypsin-like peptidase domain-containing protein [Streptomyces sp. NRRL S-118]